MRIGIIGAGTVGLAVARHALRQGHEVALSSHRGPAALAETVRDLGAGATAVPVVQAASADLVLLAVPWLAVPDALTGLPAWDGRILVDATNPFVAFDPLQLADLDGSSASEIVAGHAPGARVVKAFNSITMADFDKGPVEETTRGVAQRVLFVSGDDPAATAAVAALIESFGYAALHLGGLADGGLLQQGGGPLAGRDLLLHSTPGDRNDPT
jgi:predicted dinucleotide-binding enzyme